MQSFSFVLLGSLGLALLAAGCGLDQNGDADLIPGADGGAPSLVDSAGGGTTVDGAVHTDSSIDGTDATGSGDTSLPDDAPGPDVRMPDGNAPDTCGATEICNNGVDDDCNALADCADPACGPTAGWKCTPATPVGWTVVEYAANARAACSTGYGGPADVVEGPTAAAPTCGCTCAVSDSGSCQKGNVHMGFDGIGGSCSLPYDGNPDGACHTFPVAFAAKPDSNLKATAPGWQGGACAATPAKTVPPITYVGQGRTCGLTATTGAGCANAGLCAPSGAGYSVCVKQAGDAVCPAGFPQKHTVGTGVTDTRDCTACGCSVTGTCTDPKLTIYQDNGCGTTGPAAGSTDVKVDGQCDQVGGGMLTYTAYRFVSAVQNAQCGPTGGAATGSAALAGTQTICCTL